MPTSFTYVKKGYNPIEVDNYIDTLESVVKGYKEKDAAIKNAIINAQIAADNIVKDAEAQADQILNQIIEKVELVRGSIDKQRRLVNAFRNDYNALIQKYVVNFNDSELNDIYRDIDDLEEFIIKITSAAPKSIKEDEYSAESYTTSSYTSESYTSAPYTSEPYLKEDNADIAELLK